MSLFDGHAPPCGEGEQARGHGACARHPCGFAPDLYESAQTVSVRWAWPVSRS